LWVLPFWSFIRVQTGLMARSPDFWSDRLIQFGFNNTNLMFISRQLVELFGWKNKKLQWVQFEKIIQFIIPKYALIWSKEHKLAMSQTPKQNFITWYSKHMNFYTTRPWRSFFFRFMVNSRKEYIIFLTPSRQEVLISNRSLHTNSQKKPEFRTHNMALVLQRCRPRHHVDSSTNIIAGLRLFLK
jgi:hypothetical protein